jgi:hypothetical protein
MRLGWTRKTAASMRAVTKRRVLIGLAKNEKEDIDSTAMDLFGVLAPM